MKAIILVEGNGNRMHGLTSAVPQPLFSFCNQTIIEYQISALAKVGVNHVIVAVDRDTRAVEETLQLIEKKYDIKIELSEKCDRNGFLGPLSFVGQMSIDGEFFVISSNVIFDFPLDNLIRFHRSHEREVTVSVTEVDDAREYANSILGTNVCQCGDKAVEAGVYVVNHSWIHQILKESSDVGISSIFRGHALYPVPTDGVLADVNQPTNYLNGMEKKLKSLEAYDSANARDDPRYATVMDMRDAKGFDVIIISTGTAEQASYWQNRLDSGHNGILPDGVSIYCVDEDWGSGGAGNGLGTLYAFEKAETLALAKGTSLRKSLIDGSISVAMYHTAGKGTRLAPLPAGENNNKPGVKLAVSTGGASSRPITILESVIRQTAIYASSRTGRLSVFWGDQVFIPTAPTSYNAEYAIDILCSLLPSLPSREEWESQGLHKYGLIAVNEHGDAAQVEKVTFDEATELLKSMGTLKSVGTSLGSFSISSLMLESLLDEFATELATKEGKLDTDPHFWMPLTLTEEGYVKLMLNKGTTSQIAIDHFARMQKFKSTRLMDKIFGAVDVGQDMFWWDYGQLKNYVEYNKMMIANTSEAAVMRAFFGVNLYRPSDNFTDVHAIIDHNSVISGACGLGSGQVEKTVMTHVWADSIDANGAVLVNVTARSIKAGPGAVAYNIVDSSEQGIVLAAGEVAVGVWAADGTCHVVYSRLDIDGGSSWDTKVLENKYSFSELHKLNMTADPFACDKAQQAAHRIERRKTKIGTNCTVEVDKGTDLSSRLMANILAMRRVESGYDIIIVCTSSRTQAAFWQTRLEAARGSILVSNAEIYCVDEDWAPGGAGNGLGTLYAFEKAEQLANEQGNSILQRLRNQSISVSMYHTAGKGTRLAPLPASENNNKPGVKLPAGVRLIDGSTERPVTILESVIRQTAIYAPSRKGRLSVYWGDQVFIPSESAVYTPRHHADILASLLPEMPSESEWQKQGLEKYGVIAVNHLGDAAQVEKVSFSQAQDLLTSLGALKSVGVSLGSFSVSCEFLSCLLDEFAAELLQKSGKYDTDPHIWMPLTLTCAGYCKLMGLKGTSQQEAEDHWNRMQNMKRNLIGDDIFGAVNVGQGMYWWDYGQLPKYISNNLQMANSDQEAIAMRTFFDVATNSQVTARHVEAEVDQNSVITNSLIKDGKISRSVIQHVQSDEVVACSSILINVTARRIRAEEGSVAYNLVDSSADGIYLKKGEIAVGVWEASGKCKVIRSHVDHDGGKSWKELVCGNTDSFESLYTINLIADPTRCQESQDAAHARFLQFLRVAPPACLASSRKGVRIIGNVLIHPSAQVGNNTILGPNVCIGPSVVVGAGVRIRDSAVMDRCKIRDHALVNKSILGCGSTVGAWSRIEGLTVVGENTVIADEVLVNGAVLYPKQIVNHSIWDKGQVIM